MLAFLGRISGHTSLAAAIGSVQFFITEAERLFKLAREEQDQLFKLFAITDGIKELKLHLRRREAFLTEEPATAASACRYQTNSLRILASPSFGELLFSSFWLLVFSLPKFTAISTPVLSWLRSYYLSYATASEHIANPARAESSEYCFKRLMCWGYLLRRSEPMSSAPVSSAASVQPHRTRSNHSYLSPRT